VINASGNFLDTHRLDDALEFVVVRLESEVGSVGSWGPVELPETLVPLSVSMASLVLSSTGTQLSAHGGWACLPYRLPDGHVESGKLHHPLSSQRPCSPH
jgi:hypothetical protein